MQRADVYERRYDESTQQTDANTCPECDGRVTMTTTETVCNDCGLVLAEDGVDTGPEWRSFDGEATQRRTGAPRTPSRHDRGLSTEIGWTDGNGSALSAAKRRKFGRLRVQHVRALRGASTEQAEMHGLTEVRRITSALGFSQRFRDQAARLFSTAQDAGLLMVRSIEGIAAASVYAACRCDGRPQSLGDIGAVARVETDRVRTCYDALNRELALPAVPVPPARYLPRFVSALELSTEIKQRARAVLDDSGAPETRGSNPAGVAAGAVLVATRQLEDATSFTQTEIARLADVSVVTVRKHRDVLAAGC
jgi:transcription initiation factor TFIIB